MKQPDPTVIPIVSALIVAIFPHLMHLPLWIPLWCSVMWGYLLLSAGYHWPMPGKNFRRTLTLIGIIGVLVTFNRHLDQNAFISLMAVMAALKPFEMASHRDLMITVFLAYFIVITSLFVSETLVITLYMFFSVMITTAVLIRINDPGGRFKNQLALSARMMAQAIPVMIVLFLLFPRIQGSLFGLSIAGSAKSGFSDRLAPGSVARLVKDNAVAFRAEFDGDIPETSSLYWRGIVFQNFDGRAWHAAKNIPTRSKPPAGQHPVTYTIALEPHQEKWMFVLEMPAITPPRTDFFSDYTLRARRTIKQQFRYKMTSNTQYRSWPESSQTLDAFTRLPQGYNPKTRDLAAKLTENTKTSRQKAERLLDFFGSGAFEYQLKVPTLGKNSVDDFIFQSQKGYCEHFATAFVFMMRAVDVPARVVGGYQGGKRNPFANYLIVRQSDAHVWAEIWAPDHDGWLRMDPTAVVAPDRIRLGLEGALSAGELSEFLPWQPGQLIQQILLVWDLINTRWQAWFEGYSHEEQNLLLEKIGLSFRTALASLQTMAILLLAIIAIVAAYAGFVLISFKDKPDTVTKYYAIFCSTLSKAGYPRAPNQGPVDYAVYVSENQPDLKDRVNEITDLYIQLRYRGQDSPINRSELIRRVRQLKKKLS